MDYREYLQNWAQHRKISINKLLFLYSKLQFSLPFYRLIILILRQNVRHTSVRASHCG